MGSPNQNLRKAYECESLGSLRFNPCLRFHYVVGVYQMEVLLFRSRLRKITTNLATPTHPVKLWNVVRI